MCCVLQHDAWGGGCGGGRTGEGGVCGVVRACWGASELRGRLEEEGSLGESAQRCGWQGIGLMVAAGMLV